jgi:hypothetical protein
MRRARARQPDSWAAVGRRARAFSRFSRGLVGNARHTRRACFLAAQPGWLHMKELHAAAAPCGACWPYARHV